MHPWSDSSFPVEWSNDCHLCKKERWNTWRDWAHWGYFEFVKSYVGCEDWCYLLFWGCAASGVSFNVYQIQVSASSLTFYFLSITFHCLTFLFNQFTCYHRFQVYDIDTQFHSVPVKVIMANIYLNTECFVH